MSEDKSLKEQLLNSKLLLTISLFKEFLLNIFILFLKHLK